jgi:hypothetical protein
MPGDPWSLHHDADGTADDCPGRASENRADAGTNGSARHMSLSGIGFV